MKYKRTEKQRDGRQPDDLLIELVIAQKADDWRDHRLQKAESTREGSDCQAGARSTV